MMDNPLAGIPTDPTGEPAAGPEDLSTVALPTPDAVPVELLLSPRTRDPVPEREAIQARQAEQDDLLDVFTAGLALNNPLSGAIRYGAASRLFPPKKDYNPYRDDAERLKGLPLEPFRYSMSPEETDFIASRIEQQAADRALVERHTGLGTLAGVVGLLGNPLLLPALAVPESIPALVALNSGAELASELALHAEQPGRTFTESAINVGSAALLTGVLGGLAGRLSRAEHQRAADALNEHVRRSMGAAEAPATTLAQETPTPGAGLLFSTRMGNELTTGPGVALLNESRSVAARRFAQQVDDILRTRAHEQGIATPLTFRSLMGEADKADAQVIRAFNEAWQTYREGGGRLSEEIFAERVSLAMRHGDVSPIPEVQELAQRYRQMLDDWFNRAVELDLFPKEIKDRWLQAVEAAQREGKAPPTPAEALRGLARGSETYLPRIYNRLALRDPAVRGRFLALLRGRLVEAITDRESRTVAVALSTREFVTYDAHGNRLVRKAPSEVHLMSREEAEQVVQKIPGARILEAGTRDPTAVELQATDIAERIMATIEGMPGDVLDEEYLIPKAGSLHERTLGFISDDELADVGVLVNDARDILMRHGRSMLRDISLNRLFGEREMRAVREEITREYLQQITRADKAGNLEEVASLRRQMERDLHHVDLLRERMLGTRGRADPASVATQLSSGLRLYNTVTLLGGVALSNLTDVLAPALRHGLLPWAGAFARFLTDFRSYRHAKAMAQRFGLAVEALTGHRLVHIVEGESAISRHQAKALAFFGKVTGMNFITDTAQTVGATLGVKRIARLAARYDRLGKGDRAWLAEIGIDQGTAQRITQEIAAHGETIHGVLDPRIDLWSDSRLAERFENAIRRDVRLTVVEPGIVEIPGWMDGSEMGRVLAQFQRFNFSATQRLLARGLQRRDAEFLSGVIGLLLVGAMVEAGKSAVRGEDVSEKDALDWMAGAVDRSGVLGLPGIALSMGYSWATGSRTSRFLLRAPWSAFTGPGPEHAWRTSRAATRLLTGQGRESDIWTTLKGLPFINTLHIIDLLRVATEGYGWRDHPH